MDAIKTNGVSKSYGRLRALGGVSFSVEKGEIVGLLGPNGAGKTTLMKILTGYLEPDEGEARIAGIDVVDDPLAVQARIGYLPESAPLYHEMAVQEYLQMMAQLRAIPVAEQAEKISAAVVATGLDKHLTRPIGKLSKGYRQRVGIAQAIVHAPEILILDEPTSGLDPGQIVEIRDLIKELSARTTVMLSTHILSEVEMTCERVIIIANGELQVDSPLSELRGGQANAAVVAVDSGATGVRELLEKVPGAVRVEAQEGDPELQRWRVIGRDDAERMCPAIFDALRKQSWDVFELRPDVKTLETVFRELAYGDKEARA